VLRVAVDKDETNSQPSEICLNQILLGDFKKELYVLIKDGTRLST
jgi:hypothetical protein